MLLFSSPWCPSPGSSEDIRLCTGRPTIPFLKVLKAGCVQFQPSVFGMSTTDPGTGSRLSPRWFCVPKTPCFWKQRESSSRPELCGSGRSHGARTPFCNTKFPGRKEQAILPDSETPGLGSLLAWSCRQPSPQLLGQGAVSFSSFQLSVHVPPLHSAPPKVRTLPIPASADILASPCPLWATTHHKQLGYDIQLCPGCVQIS